MEDQSREFGELKPSHSILVSNGESCQHRAKEGSSIGGILVAVQDKSIQLFHIDSAGHSRRKPVQEIALPWSKPVLAFSPDDEILAIGSTNDVTIMLWKKRSKDQFWYTSGTVFLTS